MVSTSHPANRAPKALVLSLSLSLSLAACGVSTQQEVQMGESYAAEINKELPIIADPEVNRYINLLGDSLAKVADTRNLEWHFYVVDSKEVNAFAVPGGFVYVNRGLIERATKMDQLAGVVGHEIGHVVKRHTIAQMQKQQRANVGVTLACVLTRVCESQAAQAGLQLGAGALFARFSRTDEAEADAEGVKFCVAARISPRGMPEMFQILLDERKKRPEGVDAWFQTHPLEEDRIEATKALIAQYDSAQLDTYSVDSPNFQAFKQRVMSLPPSPPPKG